MDRKAPTDSERLKRIVALLDECYAALEYCVRKHVNERRSPSLKARKLIEKLKKEKG